MMHATTQFSRQNYACMHSDLRVPTDTIPTGALGQFRGKAAAFLAGALVVGLLTRYSQLFGGGDGMHA